MKIGILTVPFNNNYGGFLQAFALKKVLTDMGHDVMFINRRPRRSVTLKSVIRDILIELHLYESKERTISKYTSQFQKKYLYPYTKAYYTSEELKKCLRYKFDTVIVGSDQVWRYRYYIDDIDDSYCGFINGAVIPHFSYAASMGTDEMDYPLDKIEICSKLLKDFKAISVREESSARLLKEYFGVKDAQVVLDPTFLIDKQVYVDLFKESYEKPNKPYIFTYILDDSIKIQRSIEDFSRRNNMTVVNLKAQTGDLTKLTMIEPVEKWLSAIYYADYVITDSFHGTVFSLIFNKQFVVYGNVGRGLTRMQDLLERVGLSERLLIQNDGVEKVLKEEINWTTANKHISDHKESSMLFLKNAINN